MAASPSRRPSPHALRLPKPSLVIACARSRLRPKIVRVDAALELLQALPSWAKILPRAAGLHFAVRTGDGRVTPYTLCDQGRNLGRARGSMGLGVKLTAPRLPQGREREQLAALEPAPLPFAVVCVLRDPARVDEALAMCRARGLGGEAGYGLIRPTRRLVLVYDVARSPAWFVNHPPDGKPTARLCVSPARPWAASVRGIGRLPLGAPILARYGGGSSHHRAIAEERSRRAERSPIPNARRAQRRARMAALTALRLAGAGT